ncbi:MAG: lipopolysaccharide biosynthesis protein [Prevotellaceae bacterium]|jgi:O-antigen/teichoic acid export membrane protein|nr:lipopolysaccharide biosynthesis protein [Prevotellaceae bacterium]
MSSASENNKRIAKNTLFLYFRLLITMGVNLYTARVVLATLGVEDYGIYNVVGGVVVMFAWLNSGMLASSQRFISFELGRNSFERLHKVFCNSVSIHLCIALVILLCAETAGLWFMNTKLNINPLRISAANWVYQCSVFSLMVGIVCVPYNSCIVAHEHMKTYAYVSIIDVVLKLAIVYFLSVWNIDKLKFYAVLVLAATSIVQSIYLVYCRHHFPECKYRFSFDKDLFRQMFAFAGWSFIGNLSHAFKEQGSNILLNLFFGTFVNAARGIAGQVNAAVNGFTVNFQMALNPQIVKSYASGNYQYATSLVSKSSRYSFYLLLIVSVPAFVNMEYLLGLWLTVVPEYTVIFVRMILLISLVNSLSGSIGTMIQASGKVRNYNIIVGLIIMLDLPISYFILKAGYLPYTVMYVALFTATASLFARLFIMKRIVEYSARYFIVTIFCKNIFIAGTIIYALLYVQSLFPVNFLTFISMSLFSVLFIFGIIYIIGLSLRERIMVKNKILNRIIHFK